MERLSVESLNKFIDSVTTSDSELGVPLPRTMTYPDQIYIDMDKLIDKRAEFIDLYRQNLVAFSKVKKNIPEKFLYCTGERNDKGEFRKWSSNPDDINRFISMGMLTNIILDAGAKEISINGKMEKGFFITLSDEQIKPIVVREEEPKAPQMRKAKEPEDK